MNNRFVIPPDVDWQGVGTITKEDVAAVVSASLSVRYPNVIFEAAENGSGGYNILAKSRYQNQPIPEWLISDFLTTMLVMELTYQQIEKVFNLTPKSG